MARIEEKSAARAEKKRVLVEIEIMVNRLTVEVGGGRVELRLNICRRVTLGSLNDA